jgi:hypothetical protein
MVDGAEENKKRGREKRVAGRGGGKRERAGKFRRCVQAI